MVKRLKSLGYFLPLTVIFTKVIVSIIGTIPIPTIMYMVKLMMLGKKAIKNNCPTESSK